MSAHSEPREGGGAGERGATAASAKRARATRPLAVLVVDDEESLRHGVARSLERRGHAVRRASGGAEALELLSQEGAEVVLSDLRMPGIGGHELFERLRAEHPGTAVVLMTAHGTIADAVAALQRGVDSYLAKPFERDEMVHAVERAGERVHLRQENAALRSELLKTGPGGGLVGEAPAFQHAMDRVVQFADREGSVLITGESGTGKELVARALHRLGPRASGPFVARNLGAFPDELFASEMFGVKAGAFTGAERDRPGAIDRAAGGTLFLDEIAEASASAQVSLLRFLEEGEVAALGEDEARQVDVRVLAATHRDLAVEVREGRFREDLFFRLDVLRVEVPALRERREDVPQLVRHFLGELGREDLSFSDAALESLRARAWPGNLRELRNLVERMAAVSEAGELGPADLPDAEGLIAPAASVAPAPYRQAMETFERAYLEELLTRSRGNVAEASRLAGLARASLHARARALGVELADFRKRSP